MKALSDPNLFFLSINFGSSHIYRLTDMIAQLQNRVEEKVIMKLSEEIDRATPEAFQRMKELMRNAPPAVSFRAAESLLDRWLVSAKRHE